MIDKVVVFTGSKKDFEIFLEKQIPEDSETIPFMELIQHYNARLRPNESGVRENALRANIEVDNCVVRADDYGSVMPHVLSNFANIVNLNYAFYELFDEGKYVDTNYSVELGQAIFLLTCNFSNENEIKKALGPAMFSRIGCCVEYADLTVEQKQKIVNNWYDSIMASLKDDERVYIETTDIHEWFLKNAERYDNIRILKSKMENAIFEKLTDHFIIMTGSMAEGTQDRV